MTEDVTDDKSKKTEIKTLVKNATDLQRLKLERLMKNPVSVNYFISTYCFKIHTMYYYVGKSCTY